MKELLKKFNIETENEKLYEMAFTHTSYSNHHDLNYSYERLEFLGDSILGLVVSEYLYNKYPNYNEGDLTKIRSNFVCQTALIFYSHELGLDEYVKISSEDSFMTENEVLSITADVFESFLGAMFLDQGMDFAKNYLAENIFTYIDQKKVFFFDYKSFIKEYADSNGLTIEYRLLKETGVPHNKTFLIAVYVDDVITGAGRGKNKKEAQQNAAKKALENIEFGVF